MKAIATGLGTLAMLASASIAFTPPLSAQSGYANVIGNDMSKCASGKGPAVRLHISGLKNSNGNLFVRTYKANNRDWLESKRYISRLDARPRSGSMTVCIPLPSSGRYAIAVQHDINGNRSTDFSIDGAGMSNNPSIGSFLGIPRPPSVEKAAFSAGSGVTQLSIRVRYRD